MVEANIKKGLGFNAFERTVARGIDAIFQKYEENNIFGRSKRAYFAHISDCCLEVEAKGKYRPFSKENPGFIDVPVSVTYKSDFSSIEITVNHELFQKDAESLADFMLKAMPEIKPESLTIKRNYVPKNVEEMAKLYVKR